MILSTTSFILLLFHFAPGGGDIAQKTADFATQLCLGVPTNITVDPAEADVVTSFMGPVNYLELIVTDTQCGDWIPCAEKYQTDLINTALRIAVGILLLVITVIFFVLIAGPCGCCRCCRRCCFWCCFAERQEARNMTGCKKLFLFFLFMIYIGGLIAVSVYASAFRASLNTGASGFLCATFQLASDALNGYNSTNTTTGNSTDLFIGMVNVENIVNNISSMVDDNSTVLVSLQNVISDTAAITFAIDDFLAELNSMNDNLGNASNSLVGDYQCVFCSTCCSGGNSSQVGQAIVTIDQSVGSALSGVRTSVNAQLSGPNLQNIRDSLNSAATTMNTFIDEFENSIGTQLVDREPLFESILNYLNIAMLVVACIIALPTILMIISMYCGMCRSKRDSFSDPNNPPQNPCHASCTCCVAFLLAFLFFLLAGIVGIIAYIEASACDMLSPGIDVMVNKTAFRFGLEANGTMQEIITTCLSSGGSGDLLGSITVGNGTARDNLNFSSTINAQFDSLTAQMNGTIPPFSTNDAVVSLLTSLNQYGSLFIMTQDAINQLNTNATLQPTPQFIQQVGTECLPIALQSGITTVPDCGGKPNLSLNGTTGTALKNALVSAGFPLSDTQTSVSLGGSSAYYTTLNNNNMYIGENGSTCPADFLNLSTATVDNQGNPIMNPTPFNYIMIKKMEVLTHIYSCNTVNVTAASNGTAVITHTTSTCTWDQWNQYITDTYNSLLTKAANIDSVTNSTVVLINEQLRAIVQDQILPPIDTLINGLNCKFLYERWTRAYQSLCWQQTPGLVGNVLNWLIFGILCWLCIIIQFVIWRHLKDNRCIWRDNVKNGVVAASGSRNHDTSASGRKTVVKVENGQITIVAE